MLKPVMLKMLSSITIAISPYIFIKKQYYISNILQKITTFEQLLDTYIIMGFMSRTIKLYKAIYT